MNNTEPTETRQRLRQRAPFREFPDWAGTPAQWLENHLLRKPDTEWLRLDWKEVWELREAAITLAAIRHIIPQGSQQYFGGHDRIADLTRIHRQTVSAHIEQLLSAKKIFEIVNKRACSTYSLVRPGPTEDCGILPIGFLGQTRTFADRCLLSIAISNTYKVMHVETVNDKLDLDDLVVNHRISIARLTGPRWTELTGLDRKTFQRSREKLLSQKLIVHYWDSIWVSDNFEN